MSNAVILLAVGGSTRLGMPEQLLVYNGRTPRSSVTCSRHAPGRLVSVAASLTLSISGQSIIEIKINEDGTPKRRCTPKGLTIIALAL